MFSFAEKEFVSEKVNKIAKDKKIFIISLLEKQFENIVSSNFSYSTTFRKTNMNLYKTCCIEFEEEEYKLKQKNAIHSTQMKEMVTIPYKIIDKMKQMREPGEFVSDYIDTLKTLNETTDKITAYKNADAIIAILTNMKTTAETIIQEAVKTEQELATLEISKETNADRIIALELELTEKIINTRKQLEELKKIR